MKAIETVYAGDRYRSRLEAKWAVFFRTLGIEYQYEKEGYDLDGVWYLPDFWLPGLKRWIEIKAEAPTEEELMKVKALHEGSGYPACLFYGLPGEHPGWGYSTCSHDSNGGSAETDELKWSMCMVCLSVDVTIRHMGNCHLYNEADAENDVVYESCIYDGGSDCYYKAQALFGSVYRELSELTNKEGKRQAIPIAEDPFAGTMNHLLSTRFEIVGQLRNDHPHLIAAYTTARQARFEHGAHGIR